MSKTVSLHYPTGSTYIGGEGHIRHPAYDKIVTYPDGCVLHYDTNQHTLLIKSSNGEPLAAFAVSSFSVDSDIEIGEACVVPGRPAMEKS